jgi:Domain of Unknown Function with PDB structure (DUF3857)/Transglutaminase-like superfamily
MQIARNILILLSVFIVSCSAANSNIKSITVGDVGTYLKQSPKAEEHLNAGTNMLLTYTYVEFFSDGTSVTRHSDRIKIFNERGRDFASKTISYREGYQEVKIIFANTIKPDGKVIALDKKDIHDSSEYSGYEFYTDIKEKRFTMPAVEDGCIIEYAYEIKNLKPVLPFDFFANFYLQNYSPMEEDIMEVVLPAQIDLKYKKFLTTLTPQIMQEGNKKKYIFTNTKQKEIIPEPRMPSVADRSTFPQLSVWTLSNWEVISHWYLALVNEQVKSDVELETFTRKLIAGKNTDEEKINEIFSFVSQKIRYIAVLLGPYTHQPHPAFEIFQKRYGDCKDKTTLLLTMLKIAGIQALPVLVPAYGEYFDETIPSLEVFNHVIAVVPIGNNKYFWLDATNETAAYNSVPFFRPTTVFVINTDGSYSLVKTPALDDKKDFYKADIKYNIGLEGDASMNCTYTYSGKTAESIRYYYKYSPPEQRKKNFESRGIEVKELTLGSFTNTQEPFVMTLKGNIKNLAQKLDDNMMVLSNIIYLDSFRDITAAKDRKYPIAFKESYYSQEIYSYVFPEGFKIKKIPPAFELDKPFRYRTEKYNFLGSTFEVSIATKGTEQKIKVDELEDFKKNALEIQKHESALKNIIFEKDKMTDSLIQINKLK